MRWAYDFDEARRPAWQSDHAGDRRATCASDSRTFSSWACAQARRPEPQAGEIAALLTSQNALRGVAFAPQGAKTNNTTGRIRPTTPRRHRRRTELRHYRGASLAIPGRDGDRFIGALGLDRETANHFGALTATSNRTRSPCSTPCGPPRSATSCAR